MDLDKVKKSWQEVGNDPIVDESKIRRMIGNEGVSAYVLLVKRERFLLCMLIALLLPLLLLHYYSGAFVRSVGLTIFFYFFYTICIIWQIYKYRYLRKLDMGKGSIIAVSRYFIRYVKYLAVEFLVVTACLSTYTAMVIFSKSPGTVTEYPLLMSFLLLGIVILLLWYLVISYKSIYMKIIRTLGKSLREMRERGDDDN